MTEAGGAYRVIFNQENDKIFRGVLLALLLVVLIYNVDFRCESHCPSDFRRAAFLSRSSDSLCERMPDQWLGERNEV
jgi:hypothetical protein